MAANRRPRYRESVTKLLAYHEAYWAAVAATAPVIGLANTVVLTDAIRLRFELDVVPVDDPGWPRSFRWLLPAGRSAINYLLIGGLISILTQAYVLFEALTSLADGKNEYFPLSATILEAPGLLYVALLTGYVGLLRNGAAASRRAAKATDHADA
jgi:hypothetical protein